MNILKKISLKQVSRLQKSLLSGLVSAALLSYGAQAFCADPIYPVVVDNSTGVLMENLVIPADAATKGMWSPLVKWPIISIHANALPDGRIVTFGGGLNNDEQDGRTLVFWNPKFGFDDSSRLLVDNPAHVDSFCSSATFLSDGRMLTSGGGSYAAGTSKESTLIDYRDSSSTRVSDLISPRWYGTMTRLPDGRAVITGGGVPYAASKPNSDTTSGHSSTPEIYTEGEGWKTLTGAFSVDAFGARNARWWYPRQWVTPTGTVFGISTEKMWEMRTDGNGSIHTIGNFKVAPNHHGEPPNTGPTSTAVMFDTGKVIQVGGNGYDNYTPTPSSNLATVFDFNNIASGNVDVTEVKPMAFPRQWANSTVLPTGDVLVTGGTKFNDHGGHDTVLESEIWQPATGEWTVGAPAAEHRSYHSSALLMREGTVFTAGSGAPGPRAGLDMQLYYPSYLFTRAGQGSVLAQRPEIISLSSNSVDYNQTIDVQVGDNDEIAEVSLIALGMSTHSFDSGQRRMKLNFTQSNAGTLRVTLPANANLAPPGYYHLSVVNETGVPSVSTIIGVQSEAPVSNDVSVPNLVKGEEVQFAPIGWDGYLVRHQNHDAKISMINESSSQSEINDSTFIVRDGRADASCYSFESKNFPGDYLIHRNFNIILAQASDHQSRKSSTWCARASLTHQGAVSFEAFDQPGHYIMHKDFNLVLKQIASKATLAKDASFTPIQAVQPPQVVLSQASDSPGNVSGSLEAQVTSPGSEVVKVEFYYNGDQLISTDTSAPYELSWDSVVNGSYTLKAIAYNAAGLQTTSNPLTIVVNSSLNVPPVVSLAKTTQVAGNVSGTVVATATDPDGSISRVEFYYNGNNLLSVVDQAPYALSWSMVPDGVYTVTAVAFDNSGVSTTSAPLEVTVKRP